MARILTHPSWVATAVREILRDNRHSLVAKRVLFLNSPVCETAAALALTPLRSSPCFLREKIDKSTAAAIAAVSQRSTGTLSIKMHDKLAALVALGKHLGMFVQRTQNTNVISDQPMTDDEWVKESARGPPVIGVQSAVPGRGPHNLGNRLRLPAHPHPQGLPRA